MHEIELHKECPPSLSDNILSLALTRFYFFSLSLSFVAPQATINNFARQFGNRNNKNIIATQKEKKQQPKGNCQRKRNEGEIIKGKKKKAA